MNIRLSETQQRIVDHNDGALLVLAGPGSGKTRVVTERIRRLLSISNKHFHILALTFTNKAANEMKERLMDVDGIEKRAFISTIHSFCLDVLSNRGKSIGIDQFPNIFESLQDRQQLLLDASLIDPFLNGELLLKNNKERIYLINNWLEMISRYKSRFILPNMVDNNMERMIYETYSEALRASNAFDFDDILLLVYRLFIERPKIAELYRRQYKYLFVDEAQDLNDAQYELIRLLCGSDYKNVMMVGDQNQAIFTWNGGDPIYMDIFQKDFDAMRITMNENFRSSQAVVSCAKSLIDNYNIVGELPILGDKYLIIGENEKDEAKRIVDFMQNMILFGHKDIEGIVKLEDCAIIARNRYSLSDIEKELMKRNIKYYKNITANDMSVSDIFIDFSIFLRILVNNRDRFHLGMLFKRWNISIEDYDETQSLIEFFNSISIGRHNKIVVSAIIAMNFSPEMPIKMNKALDIFSEFATSIDNPEERESIDEDIRSWRRYWVSFVRSQTNLKTTLQSFLTYFSLGAATQLNQDGIALLTVHSSKGLEFDIVALVGMVEGVFPDYRAKTPIQLNEEMRNAFVAITRSKRVITFSYPRIKRMPWGDIRVQKPSRYLLNLGLSQLE